MDSPALQPMAYVCLVSSYNLPELEACLLRRPSDALLVVSDGFIAGAQRLRQRLESNLAGIRVHMLHQSETGQPLDGDDLLQGQQWVRDVLLPRLHGLARESKEARLNLTGGTKAMAVALLHGCRWQSVDYRAQGRRELQVLRAESAGERPGLDFHALPRLPVPDVSPLEVALLHGNDVHIGKPGRIASRHPQASLQLAETLWQALAGEDADLLLLFERLEWLWSEQSKEPAYVCNLLTLPWREFLAGRSCPDGLLAWLERFRALAPDCLHWDGETLTLPGNGAHKLAKDLRAWISGTWLEQLAYRWLREAGIPHEAIALNLKSGLVPGNSSSQREADLLVHYRSITSLVEAKAGLPPGGSPAELEQQVSSLGDRFGRTRKSLLLGPLLQRRLRGEGRWESFQLRCKANSVILCTGKAELLDFVAGRGGQ